MNCQETRELLTAYLHDEVTPSERTVIRAHIAGCKACRQELDHLSSLENRLAQSLQSQVAGVNAPAAAWSQLQATLAADAHPSLWSRLARRVSPALFTTQDKRTAATGRVIMRRFAYATLLLVTIFLGTVSLIPSARAYMQAKIIDWFHYQVPGTQSSQGIGNFEAFTPYAPTYLPAGYDGQMQGISSAWPDYEALELAYSRRDWQFVKLIQSNWPDLDDLPPGKQVMVDGRPGLLISDLRSLDGIIIPYLGDGIPLMDVYLNSLDIRQMESFDAAQARVLIWHIDDVKFELFTNGLSEAELLLIANSMQPMSFSQGEKPPIGPSP